VAVAFEVAVVFDLIPICVPPRWQCLKRIKKAGLSERSEFAGLPVSGAGNVGTPRSGAAQLGSPFFGYFFWRSKKSDPAAGTDPRLASTTVQSAWATSYGIVALSLCF
jgi:hypothetical protein